ncbi:hypothetical protein [Xanthomonas cucurbitae]|uniref:Uncharacterized protein n=1 Tax=Xanthomonas cucurbitae TaxID=56453 RepID=A0ABY7Y9I4_9XANT|nr:hypothetical protein [Xanthomonas cucurbitae]WDM66656.1 hypothetical protein K6981_14090 [Xanthomonas cucurbitae]WDM70533.1 hypothetical protein K6978_14060 [Xanthomonas cucurbitae]WDM74404.1 hypothetical protein K6982_13400 [Xanthomonas cucurbitae]WDM80139.1 hypothetical protein K6980_05425 [Xanthomonas cucurbitae]WDM83831.1 hypothetical protein K6979_05430 [Xanthomonas cucurbitae]
MQHFDCRIAAASNPPRGGSDEVLGNAAGALNAGFLALRSVPLVCARIGVIDAAFSWMMGGAEGNARRGAPQLRYNGITDNVVYPRPFVGPGVTSVCSY